jgi:hypothetical protein
MIICAHYTCVSRSHCGDEEEKKCKKKKKRISRLDQTCSYRTINMISGLLRGRKKEKKSNTFIIIVKTTRTKPNVKHSDGSGGRRKWELSRPQSIVDFICGLLLLFNLSGRFRFDTSDWKKKKHRFVTIFMHVYYFVNRTAYTQFCRHARDVWPMVAVCIPRSWRRYCSSKGRIILCAGRNYIPDIVFLLSYSKILSVQCTRTIRSKVGPSFMVL